MAGCGDSTCSCNIQAGEGISVSGSGTLNNPFVITSDQPDFGQSLRVLDSDTINFTLQGAGTPDEPFEISGDATISVNALGGIADPEGGPIPGETLVYVADDNVGHWEFQTPPPSPAGAVNANNGLVGIGSAPNPLKVATSGVWGTAPLVGANSTVGLQTYIDVDGKLRAERPSSTTVAWNDVTGKPSTFAPSSHTHTAAQITDPSNLNAGKVNGVRIYSTSSSGSTPTTPTPVAGDLWFFNAS